MSSSLHKENNEAYYIYRKDIIDLINQINIRMIRGIGSLKLLFDENIVFEYKENNEKTYSLLNPIFAGGMYIQISQSLDNLERIQISDEDHKNNFIQSIRHFLSTLEDTYFDIYNEHLSNIDNIDDDVLYNILEDQNVLGNLTDAMFDYASQIEEMSLISLLSDENDLYESELENEFYATSFMIEFSYGILSLYENGWILKNPVLMNDDSGKGIFTWEIVLECIYEMHKLYNKTLLSIESNKYNKKYKTQLENSVANLRSLMHSFIENIRYILSDDLENNFPSSELIKSICIAPDKFVDLNQKLKLAWSSSTSILLRSGGYDYVPYILFSYDELNEFWNDKRKFFYELSIISKRYSDFITKIENTSSANIQQSKHRLSSEESLGKNSSSSTIQNFLSSNTGLIITKLKESGLQLSAAALQNDENISRVAGVIHNLLPTAIRFFVSYNTVENFLLNNRQWLINKLT